MTGSLIMAIFLAAATSVEAFSAPIFQEVATRQRTSPSKTEGVEIELPNFEELFARIQQVSPLARQVIQRGTPDGEKGFATIDDQSPPDMKWKVVDSNKRKTVHHIDKIENFKNLGAPLLRFRSSLKGPCVGECFANMIMELDERKKWDPQIADVYELYPIYDLDTANIAMGFGKFGDCERLGVGYCQTKSSVVPGREQLTLCGHQDFADGSTIIWGTEMEEWHNHLLPPVQGKRLPRAKTHIFCTTLVPTSEDTFDVEYVLQLEAGGSLPNWLTTPVVTETVKSLFRHAESYFQGGEGSELEQFLLEKAKRDSLAERHSILMTP